MRFNKKRKNIDAIASTSYDQSPSEHSSFYTVLCIGYCPYSLLLAISNHRIPLERQALLN